MATSGVIERNARCHRIILILVLYYPNVISTKVCPTHWFGPNCTYKCNCMTDCSDRGDCTTCAKSYFGLNCQYVDLVQIPERRRQMVLTDGKDDTCFTASNTHISVVFPRTLFTNFLLVASTPSAFDDISYSLSLDDTVVPNPCQGQVFSTFIEPNVKAFYCPTSTMVSEIILTGKGVPLLCTVSVNGGRNVALKSSQIKVDDTDSPNSAKGVDGNVTTLKTGENTCYTSATKDAESVYGVTFDQPMILFSLRIINVETTYRFMSNFTLITYDPNNAVVMNYVDVSSRGMPDVRVSHGAVLSLIKSFELKRMVKPGTSFEFCEIEAYGDCPPKTYGLDCSQSCSMNCVDQMCMATGMCWQCKDGFHGLDCSQTCSQNCSQPKCNQLDGTCKGGCKPRRYGPHCEHECKNCLNGGDCDYKDGRCLDGCATGFFGPACTLECPVNKTCKVTCNIGSNSTCKNCSATTGQCLECKPGRFGQECEIDCPGTCQPRTCLMTTGECTVGCTLGYYSADCTYRCSDHCGGNRSCDREKGSCHAGCKPGYFGERCQPREEVKSCPTNGFYGADCTKACPPNCGGKKACEQATGVCLDGCIRKYGGENCSKECKHCQDDLCDQFTGNCILGCANGYTGPDCVV